jgi:hypothetical protein
VGGPAVWAECPDNISNVFEAGNRAAADAALAGAARVIHRRYTITRVHAQYMEPRGAMGVWDPGEERYTLYADVQYPHRVRTALASNIFKVPEHQVRVIAGAVGGGFGTKGWQYPEHRLVLWAARKVGRPVRWACERREAIPADEHARDNVTDAELALDAEGRFLALRVRTLANVGAYVSSDRNLLATFSNVVTLVGVYAFPAAHVPRDHPDLVLRDLEDIGREGVAHPVRVLHVGVEGVAILARVVDAESPARFHELRVHAGDHVAASDHVVGAREGRVGGRRVARGVEIGNVVRALVPDRGGPRLGGGRGVGDRGQRLVVHPHEIGRVLG